MKNLIDKDSAASAGPENLFDFWLGTWDLTWGEDGRGQNIITRILGGAVIEERFSSFGPQSFEGLSVSVWDGRDGCWKQTWVDSSGGYLDFSGGWADGRMILERQAALDGRPVKQRMVWYNIAPDSLEWLWQRSEDNGLSWQTLWHIHYSRRNP